MHLLFLIIPNLAMYSPGEAPLHYAAANERTEMVNALLEGGANPNMQNNDGMQVYSYLADLSFHLPPPFVQ